MVHWKQNSFLYKNVLEEVENKNDINEVKAIVRKVVNDNRILCHKLNILLKSLTNQDDLVKYLQESLCSMMARHKEVRKLFSNVVGEFASFSILSLLRAKALINTFNECYEFEGVDKKQLAELERILDTLPFEDARRAQHTCLDFLREIDDRDKTDEICDNVSDTDESVVRDTDNEVVTVKIERPDEDENGKIKKFTKNRKRRYQQMKNSDKNSCTPAQKTSKFGSRQSRKSYKRQKTSNSLKSPPVSSSKEGEQSTPSPRRQRFRKRAGKRRFVSRQVDDANQNSISRSLRSSTNVSAETCSAPTATPCASCDSSELKCLVVQLVDVLNDPVSENDVYVARYKQTHALNNEDNEYTVVDDASDEEGKLSDNCENDSRSDLEAFTPEVLEEMSPKPSGSDSCADADNSDDGEESSQEQDEISPRSPAVNGGSADKLSEDFESNGSNGPNSGSDESEELT